MSEFDSEGLILGETVAQAKQAARSPRSAGERASRALIAGRQGPIPTDASLSRKMATQRRQKQAMRTTGSYVGGGGSSVNFATQRPHDPFFYWQQNNLPYDFTDARQMQMLRQMCRHIYKAHSVMASAIDIYSKWPLVGMELTCKDTALTEFYTDLFFDQLDYEEFLPSMLHEYWVAGEAFPLGSFNEMLGVWEDDELLNPDDVTVEKSPFIKEPNLYIRLPQSLRQVLTTGQPPEQYHALMRSYPELLAYTHENAKMPVSGILLKHLKFKGDNFSPRGLPIMYRALRPLMQEEMLNAAQDAIADRLYTPLVLAKIGASAQDLGTEEPWIPTGPQIAEFEAQLDTALAADFRILTTHFAVNIESVFGKESMPNFDADFERLTEKQLQSFGLSKTMLSGAGSGETYAADALNRDLISQLLGSAQRLVRRFMRERMLVVAEAQEHYDYEVRGGRRYPIMEEILEVDERGNQRIVEQPKLLVPDLKLACLAYGTQVQTPSGPKSTELLVVGDEVLAWDGHTDTLVVQPVVESRDNGVQPIYRVETKLGRLIEATNEHPFLTAAGWTQADHLAEGDLLRVGSDYEPTPSGEISERDAYFLGLMVGDGGMTGVDVRLSSADSQVIDWVRSYISGWGCEPIAVDSRQLDWRLCQSAGRRVHPNPIKRNLTDWGIWGQRWDQKRIPAAVWRAGKHAWAAFLSGYLDADGTVASDVHVCWNSSNRRLLEDTQTLLAFLDIRSDLDQVEYPERAIGDRVISSGTGYSLRVTTRKGLEDLQRILEPRIERKKTMSTRVSLVDARRLLTPLVAQQVKAAVEAKEGTYAEIGQRFGVSKSVVFRAVKGDYDDAYSAWTDPGWDEVKSVEVLDAQPTWSLGIGDSHTHVTAGLVTHNTMNMQDDEKEREFLEALRAEGVPISMKRRLVNIDLDLEDETEAVANEQVEQAVEAQRVRKRTYQQLKAEGLPIPADLRTDFDPKPLNAPDADPAAAEATRDPQLGLDPQDTSALAPTPQVQGTPPGAPLGVPAGPGGTISAPGGPGPHQGPAGPAAPAAGNVIPLTRNKMRPPESDEMRADMPKHGVSMDAPSRLADVNALAEHWPGPIPLTTQAGEVLQTIPDVLGQQAPQYATPGGLVQGPRHVGLRRWAGVTKDTVLGEEPDAGDVEDVT